MQNSYAFKKKSKISMNLNPFPSVGQSYMHIAQAQTYKL